MSKTHFKSIDDLFHSISGESKFDNPLATGDAEKCGFEYQEFESNERPKVIVKHFNQDSYNGPSVRDFILRMNMLYDTATKLLEEQKLPKTELHRKIEILKAKKQEVEKLLEKTCQIDRIPLNKLKAQEAKVIPIIRDATAHIQGFLYQALLLTNPSAFESKKLLLDALKHFSEKESEVKADIGRPDFVNFYVTSQPGADQCVSIQRTVDKTIPSTERWNREPYQGKLPNFVQCGVGYQDHNGEFHSEFSGYRHSSYSPIKVTDDFKRQQSAAQIVRQMLIELAKQELRKAFPHEDPLKLNLSSLTLLTPYHRTDSIVPKGEEEHKQLLESYNAVMMYNNRRIELTAEELGLDKPYNVRLNATILNAPGNPFGVSISKRGTPTRLLGSSTLEENINAQGMSQFIRHAFTHIKGIQNIQSFYDGMYKIYKNKSEEMRTLKTNLKEANIDLEAALGGNDKKIYMKAKQKVDNLNKEIFKIERERMNAYHKFLKQHRQDIDHFLKDIKIKKPKSEREQVAELFFQTILMYTDGKVEPIQYGARYLLANQKMGRHVDFYCKSGEDRTGRMQNMVEELVIFNRQHGHYPTYDMNKQCIDKDEQKQQSEIALVVNEFSVSRDITGENSVGARGLQIASSLAANENLPAKTGDAIGKMAKGVYSGRVVKGWGQEALKKVPILQIDTQRQKMLKETISQNKANVLLGEKTHLGFTSRLVRESQLEEYKSKSQRPAPPSARAAITSPTYYAHRIKPGDLVVSEKNFKQNVFLRIEKDLHSVRDVTVVPEGGLPPDVNEDLAIEQAFAMVNPPFNPRESVLVLSGTDDKQVERLHAVLLVLKHQVSSLRQLEIEVQGHSPRPELAKKASFQKKFDQTFIDKVGLSVEAYRNIDAKKSEFNQLISKQKSMKSVVKGERSQANGLDMIEGAVITLPPTK